MMTIKSVRTSGTPATFAPYWSGDAFDGRGGAPGLARIRPNIMPLDALRAMLGNTREGGAMRRDFGGFGGGGGGFGGFFGGISPQTLDVLREIRMRRYFGLNPNLYQQGQGGGLLGSLMGGGGGMRGTNTLPVSSMLASFMPGQGPGRNGGGF